MANRRQNWRGFTLIEILVVLVILGIASAVIVPQIGRRDDLTASAATRMIMADLIYAQNKAIAMQCKYCVVFDTTNKNYQLYQLANGSTTLTAITHPITKQTYVVQFKATGATPAKPTKGFENVTLTSASMDGKLMLAFDELGTPYSGDPATPGTLTALAAGAVQITAGNYSMTVNVEPYTGELSVTTP